MKLTIDGRTYEVEVQSDAVVVAGTPLKVAVVRDQQETTVKVVGRPYKVRLEGERTVVVDGREFAVEVSGRSTAARAPATPAKPRARAGEKGAIRALMPGKVLSLKVGEGEEVAAGALLLILEAMKMENEIRAPQGGVVKRVAVTPGQTVNNGDVLIVLE